MSEWKMMSRKVCLGELLLHICQGIVRRTAIQQPQLAGYHQHHLANAIYFPENEIFHRLCVIEYAKIGNFSSGGPWW